jgi:hypothetical protein
VSFLYCFLPLLCAGQQQLLHGKITNAIDVEGIHILNTSSRFNSVTDQFGNFAITVKQHDTLVFSSVHFMPEKIVVSEEIYEKGLLIVTLKELLNELDEVMVGPRLSGNLKTDIENIKTEQDLNFYDVGIPGFRGKPEEKIVPVVPYFGLASVVDLEAMYKHLSGYYKKLRIKRKWDAENVMAATILDFYSRPFFTEAYGIPEGRLYDFMLFCLETSALQNSFNTEDFAGVLLIFENKSKIYFERLEIKEE